MRLEKSILIVRIVSLVLNDIKYPKRHIVAYHKFTKISQLIGLILQISENFHHIVLYCPNSRDKLSLKQVQN